ncbi:MAG: hypothetical protein EHM87_10215 [Burkholderiales bacterium]|nr:MAG: hypothetical protein EHM87_10215 [Burkholderiales bacterium]
MGAIDTNARVTDSIDRLNADVNARLDKVDANLAARIAESKTDLLKWMLGALTAQTALLAGIVKLL